MWTELALYVTIAAAGLAPLLMRPRRSGGFLVPLGGVLLGAAAAVALLWRPVPVDPPPDLRPTQVRDGTAQPARGFVSSDACRACHPDQYRSWHDSYHRTMTQVVTPDTVIADFEGEVVLERPAFGRSGTASEQPGRTFRAERRGDEFWVWVPELRADGTEADDSVWRRLVMSTGLHHYQLYWYPSGAGRELRMFPFVYLKPDRRWVPRGAVFLKPARMPDPPTVWNFDCLPCHSTDGQPRLEQRDGEWVYETQLAEVGISCEACHGPGEPHVRAHRDPVRRYRAHFSPEADPTIVQPRDLGAEASAQVCGQCHSVNFPLSTEEAADWMRAGPRYRAGGDLSQSRHVMRRDPPPGEPTPEYLISTLAAVPSAMDQWFWSDGQIRVTGREYNGLLESPCYRGGAFSCLSCHSMHESDPDDQLAEGMRGDAACLQCHESYADATERHTHHAPESSGSRCYSCHMPHTTYGLLKATRSHTVQSPSAAASLATGRPNACNVCHLDRSLAWTEQHLGEWYGQPRLAVPEEQRGISAAARALLRGDAGQRALAAWAMGWEEARQTSGDGWMAPLLARTLDDPYDTVRYIAARSLRRQPGFEAFEYDFVSPADQRREAVRRALEVWERSGPRADSPRAEVLLDANGASRRDLVDGLLAQRDDRHVVLAE